MSNSVLQFDHWDRNSKNFLLPHLEGAKYLVQIATGFFSVQGYDLLREALKNKQIQIMIGYDEQSKDRFREQLVEDILVHLSQWNIEDRRIAVIDLVERIREGHFVLAERIENDKRVDVRGRNRDHAKIIILDKKKAIVGSINVSNSGLKNNAEGSSALEEPGRVAYFVKCYETYWNDKNTYDLTDSLLKALLDWLRLSNPFDVYLKSIRTLIHQEEIEPPRETYKMPVEYQQVVITRILRQLKQYRGAMVVASTGLGKTVIATHVALRLALEKKTMNYIIFSPLQTHVDWKNAMKSAGLSSEIFSRELLDREHNSNTGKARELWEALELLDDKYLIIIDESQYFRNQLRSRIGGKRRSFNRIMNYTSVRNPYVLLLTATPFSKDISDLNNQLLLLPHKAEKKYVTSKGQYVFPGMIDDQVAPEAWKVREDENYFKDFLDLPISTVISTSQVAKDFAIKSKEGDYILFGTEQRWIPKIAITKVSVPLLLEDEVAKILKDRIFIHKKIVFRQRGSYKASTTTIQKEAEVAWTSSPKALADVIQQTIKEDGYKVKFITSLEHRREILGSLLEKIESLPHSDDPKIMQLLSFLLKFKNEDRKVIIFTERYSTAIYLENIIKKEIPDILVANCIEESPDGYKLKNFEEAVLPLIKGFAPQANADKITAHQILVFYDIFICTDAYSTGINLQDASVVINYDLAWTPDVIIQRAGRILRFWHNPRLVDFFFFVGDFKEQESGYLSNMIQPRFSKLNGRSRQAEKFSELPLLPESESVRFDSLGVLSSIKIEHLGLADPMQIEEFTGVSPFLRHVTILQEHKAYAEDLPDDIVSTMRYPGTKPLIFLLLDNLGQTEVVLFDPSENVLIPIKEDEVLNLIKCEKETPVAGVDASSLEKLTQKAKLYWMKQRQISEDREISRICALYLVPKNEDKFNIIDQ
jgi:superfamily II DNA or RNA helicase